MRGRLGAAHARAEAVRAASSRTDRSSALVDLLCTDADPVVAWRARLLLAGEAEQSRAMRRLRQAIGASPMAQRLLTPPRGKPLHPYAKWQGPHWTLYSLAEIGYPPGDRALLPLRDRVLDWQLEPAFLEPPRTVSYPDQPERPRRCASMEGNAIWSQLRLGLVDEARTPLLVDRLVAFQWPDGGWNCDKRKEARTSSVQETLIPLRALGHWSKATGDARARRAAMRAAELLLARHLLWRQRDGALIAPGWGGPVDKVHYPIRFYDVLSALLVMAELGLVRDRRCRAAVDLLEQKRLADGMFPVEWTNATTTDRVASRGTYADWGPRGKTRGNPLVTIDALHVLREAGRGGA
jgi:hypothetical protein